MSGRQRLSHGRHTSMTRRNSRKIFCERNGRKKFRLQNSHHK